MHRRPIVNSMKAFTLCAQHAPGLSPPAISGPQFGQLKGGGGLRYISLIFLGSLLLGRNSLLGVVSVSDSVDNVAAQYC